ncbi:MAG: amino acid adenylation domain-containing protein [Bacteroidales bacterium]|nr:amino acid adenylation domain-containing protein [Bacteroidales bacterium]
MADIISFFEKLRFNAGAIWLESDTIKLSAPKNFQNQETQDFIRNNKSHIRSILNENSIFSKEQFLNVNILKDKFVTHYPLSPAQERIWFVEQYEEGTNAYHIPSVLELDSSINIENLKDAIKQIVARHEVLRSTIEQSEEHACGIQVVHDTHLTIDEVLVTEDEDYLKLIKEDVNRPFNLGIEYPIRVKLYYIQGSNAKSIESSTKILLIINIHHIASDGWSMTIFQREMEAFYDAYSKGEMNFSLPALDIQYKDYAAWQRVYLSSEVLEEQLNFWKGRLSGYQVLELPADFIRPSHVDYKGSFKVFTISEEVCQKLRGLAQQHGVTLHSLMLTSIGILLGKYTGQNDIVIGSPIANRQHHQTADLIGYFVNTQANRILLHDGQSFEGLIKQVYQEQVEAQLYQDLPFERLVEELGAERDTSRHPVFQVMVSMQSHDKPSKKANQKILYSNSIKVGTIYEVEKFDLSFFVEDGYEKIKVAISYATSLFCKETIERLSNHFIHLVNKLVEAPENPYEQIGLLSSEEYEQIVYKWNETSKNYPKSKTVSLLFQEQVEKVPGNIALEYEGHRLTYRELNEQSNKLARYIRARYEAKTGQTLTGDNLIALYLDRSPEMVIGILAVLKAGGSYVPMDMNYPQERVDYILEDTNVELVLSLKRLSKDHQDKLPKDKVIHVDLTERLYEEKDASNLPQHSSGTNLAYIIYTSGTTGKPKGVMVEHHQVVSFAIENNYISNDKAHIVGGLSNYAFDGSIFDIFFSLLNGKHLVLIDSSNLFDLSKLDTQLIDCKVDTIFITTALFNSLIQNKAKCLTSVRQVLFGGEACSIEMVNRFKINYSESTLIHVYGPTENIVYSTFCNLSDYDTKNVVPIGKNLSDKKLYILDRHLFPVPVGIIGELYIGGAGVARGYLKRPELTEQRFISNPFATDSGKTNGYTKLYKTGDLVRWLPDGNIQFIGRNDDQVKIRGFRIELGEIEHAITQIQGVKQCCVLVKERKTEVGNNKYLAAYYVLDGSDETLTSAAILNQLSGRLPEYMLPSAFMAMESFPLTINGKLDKRALPDTDFDSSSGEYVAPTNEIETELCSVWQKALGLNRVGITDDFFRVGGNSILAIQVSHRMSKVLNCDVKVAGIFKHKTILQLLLHSEGQTKINIPKIKTDRAVLSFAQERLWFVEQYQGGTNVYHMPAVFELDSSANADAIRYALQQIVQRHEVLRSTIQHDEQERGVQVVHDAIVPIEEVMLSDLDDYRSFIREDINRPFNLSSEYPIRIKFYTIQASKTKLETPQSKILLLINTHHIASDGWSMGVFQRELYAYYEAYISKNKEFRLPALEIQYKDYAVWQKAYLTGGTLEKQLDYWKNKLLGYQTLELPTDYTRPNEIDYRGAHQGFSLSTSTSDKLRALAQRQGATLHSVMLGGLSILMGKYTGQEDIVTGSPTANRHHQQTENLIGFFVNTQTNRVVLKKHQSFEALIQQVHLDQVEAQLYQDFPFEKLVEELGVVRDTSRHPIFQVMFSVQSFGGRSKTIGQQKSYFKPFQLENAYEIAKFDLSIHLDDSQQELKGQISYAKALFRPETIERFLTYYVSLLTQLTETPEKPYSQISLLNPEEYHQIVYQWNKTYKEYPKDSTVFQLFQEQVEKTPNSIALVYEGQRLTYRELNEKSNQLARHIRAKYLKITDQSFAADTLVAIYLDRSVELVIGMLAIMKAGGAYVPLDTNYPQDRVDYILGDTQVEIVLSQKHLNQDNHVQLPHEKTILIDLAEELYQNEDTSNLPQYSTAGDLAYVIYTSGTTGKPKGATITHRSICNYNQWIYSHSCYVNAQIIDCSSSISFDATVNVLLTPLCYGQQVVICKAGIKQDINLYLDYINRHKIELIKVTPSYFSLLLNSSRGNNKLELLKCIIVGGEKANKVELEEFIRLNPSIEILHHYGPTETTVGITSFTDFNNKELLNSLESIPLGKVTSNNMAYVLDSNNIPVPINIIGELHIGGVSLARGYLNRPEFTEERFVTNWFATEFENANNYTRLYKTGDLVRWLPDGNLEFIGRNDGQVKIRGYRIELGEIEYAITQIPGIKQGCVIAKERKSEGGSNKYLVAYYVLGEGADILTLEAIQGRLSCVLPEYMVPSAFVEMKSLPMNINGKLDRRALPEPDFNMSKEEYIAPTTEIEAKVCQIWQEVLGVDRVGITDNFFKMGGNSILAIQVSHRMSKILECSVKVASVFKYSSIEGILKNIIYKQINLEGVELEF